MHLQGSSLHQAPFIGLGGLVCCLCIVHWHLVCGEDYFEGMHAQTSPVLYGRRALHVVMGVLMGCDALTLFVLIWE